MNTGFRRSTVRFATILTVLMFVLLVSFATLPSTVLAEKPIELYPTGDCALDAINLQDAMNDRNYTG